MADISEDLLKGVDAAAGVAQQQMKIAKQVFTFRAGEEERFIKVYSSMYGNMLAKLSEEERKNADVVNKLKEKANRQSQSAMLRYRKSMLSQMSAEERASALADAKAKKQAEMDQRKQAMMEEIAMAAAEHTNKADRERAIAKIRKDYEKERIKGELEVSKLSDEIDKAEKQKHRDAVDRAAAERKAKEAQFKQDAKFLKEKLDGEGSFLDKVKGTQKFLKDHPIVQKIDVEAAMEENKAAQENYKSVRESGAEEIDKLNSIIEQQEAILNDPNADEDKKQKAQRKLEEAQASKQEEINRIAEAAAQANMASMKVALGKLQDAISGAYKSATAQAETILNDYQGIIDARMQGSDKTFRKMTDTITDKLSVSPYVQSTKVLEKLKEASEQGISYNTEQRAFLAELSDKIASTFNAFDSNLLRIIRLQQADTTATRLGMEASLTKLFNSMFQDSSYLNNVADSITGALVDATSQLNYQASAEFEYVVQKWLGALSSLGMSDNSLTQIATGLNYLATGDVTNLANNSALQTLFAMSAARSENLEYSELLLNGLDANKTNELLANMIIYLKEIAENSDNQVVKAAYGDIFSLSQSDLKAISNITSKEISSLSGMNMSYSDMQSEMNNQMNQLWNRTSLASMLTNVFDNVIYSVASDMTNDPVMFSMQKMINFMTETGTDINIPFISAFGTGLDLNASVKDLMQMGLGIGQAFSLAGNIVSGLASGGGLELDSWGATETTKRGSGLNLLSTSTLGGVSGSLGSYSVNSNSDDIKNSTMNSATDDAESTKEITNKNAEKQENSLDDFMRAVVGDSASAFVLTQNDSLSKLLEELRKEVIGESAASFVKVQNDNIDKFMNDFVTAILGNSASSFIRTQNGNMENLLKGLTDSVVGSYASSYIRTKNEVLDIVRTENNTLNVSVDGMSFENGSLKATDGSLNSDVATIREELIEVYKLMQSTSTATIPVDIKSIEPKVILDDATLKAALKAVLYGEGSSTDFKGMIDTINNGLTVLSVSNPVTVKTGAEKLQVSNLVW